jgi:hypothetical protein
VDRSPPGCPRRRQAEGKQIKSKLSINATGFPHRIDAIQKPSESDAAIERKAGLVNASFFAKTAHAEILKFKILKSIYRFPNKSQGLFRSEPHYTTPCPGIMPAFTACYWTGQIKKPLPGSVTRVTFM